MPNTQVLGPLTLYQNLQKRNDGRAKRVQIEGHSAKSERKVAHPVPNKSQNTTSKASGRKVNAYGRYTQRCLDETRKYWLDLGAGVFVIIPPSKLSQVLTGASSTVFKGPCLPLHLMHPWNSNGR